MNADAAILKEAWCLISLLQSEGALFVQLNAAVKGSHKDPYRQNIRIVWRPDYSAAEIEGDCTCPVGYNCKHVAAACLMYQNSNLSFSASNAKPSCLDWLDSLHQQAPGQHDTSQEFIAYILKPGNAKHEFTVEFLITKEKKTGGINKGRKTTLNNLRYSYSYLNYVQPEDQEIAKLLTALNPAFRDEPLIAGATGYLALSKLLKTGRLFWQDVGRAPLIKGIDRDLKFSWRTAENGDYQLAVEIDPPAFLLLTEPPQYLDEGLGVIGTLNTHNLSSDQLKNILAAPPIPAEYADEFSQRLIIEHPSLPLPAPKKVELIEADQLTPTPKLLLFGHQVYAPAVYPFYGGRFQLRRMDYFSDPTGRLQRGKNRAGIGAD